MAWRGDNLGFRSMRTQLLSERGDKYGNVLIAWEEGTSLTNDMLFHSHLSKYNQTLGRQWQYVANSESRAESRFAGVVVTIQEHHPLYHV